MKKILIIGDGQNFLPKIASFFAKATGQKNIDAAYIQWAQDINGVADLMNNPDNRYDKIIAQANLPVATLKVSKNGQGQQMILYNMLFNTIDLLSDNRQNWHLENKLADICFLTDYSAEMIGIKISESKMDGCQIIARFDENVSLDTIYDDMCSFVNKDSNKKVLSRKK